MRDVNKLSLYTSGLSHDFQHILRNCVNVNDSPTYQTSKYLIRALRVNKLIQATVIVWSLNSVIGRTSIYFQISHPLGMNGDVFKF